MIDILDKAGPDAMAQVNFSTRSDRGQFLSNSGGEPYAMLRAVDLCLGRDYSGRSPSEEAHSWVCSLPAMVTGNYLYSSGRLIGGSAASKRHGGDRRASTYDAGFAGTQES
jgi:hypothetical protein